MGKWKASSEELVARFSTQMKQVDDIQHKKMFGYPCCFKNGNMFTGLHEENWVLRLPEEDREELIDLGGKPFEPMGRKMKEYVLIPSSILLNVKELTIWIQRSLTFVSSLPSKT